MKTMVILWIVLFLTTRGYTQEKAPLVHISSLNKAKSDTVRLKGYVFDIYVCPPCPKGAQCKPCMENHLTVVEKRPTDPFKVPLETRLRIFTQRPDSLKVGKRYMFTVLIRNRNTSAADNVTLISFKPI